VPGTRKKQVGCRTRSPEVLRVVRSGLFFGDRWGLKEKGRFLVDADYQLPLAAWSGLAPQGNLNRHHAKSPWAQCVLGSLGRGRCQPEWHAAPRPGHQASQAAVCCLRGRLRESEDWGTGPGLTGRLGWCIWTRATGSLSEAEAAPPAFGFEAWGRPGQALSPGPQLASASEVARAGLRGPARPDHPKLATLAFVDPRLTSVPCLRGPGAL
jgi:hypothetical protein